MEAGKYYYTYNTKGGESSIIKVKRIEGSDTCLTFRAIHIVDSKGTFIDSPEFVIYQREYRNYREATLDEINWLSWV